MEFQQKGDLQTLESLAKAIGQGLKDNSIAWISVADQSTAQYIIRLAMKHPASFELYMGRHVKHPSRKTYELTARIQEGQPILAYSPIQRKR